MKTGLFCGISAVALTLGAISGASAQDMGGPSGYGDWYVSIFGGITFADSTTETLGAGYRVTTSFDDGYTIGIAAGREVMANLRGELELSHTESKNDKISVAFAGLGGVLGSVGGQMKVTYLMANLWYDLDTGSPLRPYVGGGLGVGFADWKLVGLNDSSTEFAFQAGAGVKYAISDGVDFDLGYRYRSLPDTSFSGAGLKWSDSFDTHNILATVTFDLGAM